MYYIKPKDSIQNTPFAFHEFKIYVELGLQPSKPRTPPVSFGHELPISLFTYLYNSASEGGVIDGIVFVLRRR